MNSLSVADDNVYNKINDKREACLLVMIVTTPSLPTIGPLCGEGGISSTCNNLAFVFLTIDLKCKLIIGLQKIINILQRLNKAFEEA